MKSKFHQYKKLIKKILISFLMTVGISEFQFRQAQAQIIWEPIETPKQDTPL